MLIPVILCGGTGTRLWPVSREAYPKPFMRLHDGQSLLQKTLGRVLKLPDIKEILTVTHRDYYFKAKDEYAPLNSLARLFFLLEPCRRNTAPAIGMAAFYAREAYGRDSVLLVLPADHVIKNQEAFETAVLNGYALAQENKLITLGIKPFLPETGFGYIKLDQPYQTKAAYRAECFVEKPNAVLAEQYVQSGQYLWNSGIFCFKAETILSELETWAPTIFEATRRCWQQSNIKKNLSDAIDIDSKTFHDMADLSIDYAVMEKTKNILVMPCDFDWNDMGSWHAISDGVRPDEQGNRVVGDALLMDVSNSFIQSEDRLVAAIGIDNLIVVDTPDALLVADRDRSQEVKKIVDQLKQNNHAAYKTHRTVFRPWGTFTVLEEGEYFKIKRIVVKPGASLSLQIHHHRSEHWVVVSGTAQVTKGNDTLILNTNESTFIPKEHQHRLGNPGLNDLVLIEVQTGTYLGEDDIVRFEDQYGRV